VTVLSAVTGTPLADGGYPAWSWNLVADVREMWQYPFMVNAFRAGTVVAVTAGVMGWFMVLRRQSFAGHTLATVGFPGAAGAVLVGVSATYGYFVFCVGAALVIAAVPRAGRDGGIGESALTGTVQAFLLACGFLFTALYKGLLGGTTSLLFGSFLGITAGQVWVLLAVAAGVLALLALIGRPLLFASVDPDVAAARGVPLRPLATAFLVLLGAAAAETSQITGTLLVFALLVMPAATAQALTARPARSLALSAVIAVAVTWLGLTVAYYSPYPIGFWVTTFAFGAYVLARLGQVATDRAARARGPRGTGGTGGSAGGGDGSADTPRGGAGALAGGPGTRTGGPAAAAGVPGPHAGGPAGGAAGGAVGSVGGPAERAAGRTGERAAGRTGEDATGRTDRARDRAGRPAGLPGGAGSRGGGAAAGGVA
jgi:zinc/manganese transport system permease protein